MFPAGLLRRSRRRTLKRRRVARVGESWLAIGLAFHGLREYRLGGRHHSLKFFLQVLAASVASTCRLI